MNNAHTTILVVEEEFLLRIVATEGLREAGFKVFAASSADEALNILAAGARVDLILIEFRMPGSINGLGLARFVRRARPHLMVVFLSAEASDSSLRPWAQGFLSKPCDIGIIVKTLTNMLAFA